MSNGAWDRGRNGVGHYGASKRTRDSETEGRSPYAWDFYRMLQSGQGTAYSKEMTGLLHAENLAEARALAGFMRAGEKLQRNSFPSTADESLKYWVDTLGVVVFTEDSDADVRERALAKYRIQSGNDILHLTAVLQDLLGDALVEIHTQEGADLANPPDRTYWPGVNPGPTTFDLGDGAWYSDRARILVEIDRAQFPNTNARDRALGAGFGSLMRDMLPAWAQADWAEEASFTLGVSKLDVSAVA